LTTLRVRTKGEGLQLPKSFLQLGLNGAQKAAMHTAASCRLPGQHPQAWVPLFCSLIADSSFLVKLGRFWKFSLDEFAKCDLPASIKYIKKETGAQKVRREAAACARVPHFSPNKTWH